MLLNYLTDFIYHCTMKRIRTYGSYFQAFIETLDEKVRRKVDYAL